LGSKNEYYFKRKNGIGTPLSKFSEMIFLFLKKKKVPQAISQVTILSDG